MAEFKGTTLDNAKELVYLVGNIAEGEQGEHSGCSPYRGYRKELLKEKLSLLEESFMMCSRCNGVLRNGCSVKGGLAQVCEECVESGEDCQPIGGIRSAVIKIVCNCPLIERGCEWNGVLGTVLAHLEECGQFVIVCPFVKYGCKKELKRQALEEHRKEAKEYHTEIVSVFMAEKVEKLEEEKKQQGMLIGEQNKKINQLEAQIKQLMTFNNFVKFEGVAWVIQNRHKIVNVYNEKKGKPQDATTEKSETTVYSGDPNYHSWGGSYYDGPKFVIGTYYYLYPRLNFQSENEATLLIYAHNASLYEGKINWPLRGKCMVKLINQSEEEDWIFENDKFQINNGSSFEITKIPFETLLDEKYMRENTITMEILFQLHP